MSILSIRKMQDDYSPETAIAYMDSWDSALNRVQSKCARLFSAAMSGIVLIVATIGFSLDNVSRLLMYEKWLLVASLACLIIVVVLEAKLLARLDELEGYIVGFRAAVIFTDTESVPRHKLEGLRDHVMTQLAPRTGEMSIVAFFVVAILLGVICFLSIVLRL